MYIPSTKWTWSFAIVSVVQAIVALAIESYVFGKFQTDLNPEHKGGVHNEFRTVPTYLAVFMFGYLYQLVLVYDALQQKNTIQVIGLVLYNLGLLIYASIQWDQVRDAVRSLDDTGLITDNFWVNISGMLVALPIIMAVFTTILAFLAWKLYDEFAWTIYKHISADLRLKRRYLTYQIYIALLKFDFFFFLAFTIQFLVVVENTTDIEKGLTAAALVITFILLFLAAFWVRRESVVGMIVIIIVYFIALAYFLFKLVRMWAADADRLNDYRPARKSLTSFAVLTILLLLVTIAVACWCTHNFNKGLKPHVSGKRTVGEGKQVSATEMPYVSGPQPGARMEID